MHDLDKWLGSLIGLAVGDCLGVPLEFTGMLNPFKPTVKTIKGGGPFKLPVGAWTDDTSMALCLGESLVECKGFDPYDQMRRYVRWHEKGHNSSIGFCFDIGGTCSVALRKFKATNEAYAGSENPKTAGNGSLMRLAPAPMAAISLKQAVQFSRKSSRTTHAAPQALDACGLYGALIYKALHGVQKGDLFAYTPSWVKNEEVQLVMNGSYKHADAAMWVRGNGYVVNSLEAALWALYNTTNFRDGAILAVNLGEDTDTTGAIYGQLAGAIYGLSGIPQEWVSKILHLDYISALATQLYDMANVHEDAQTTDA